MKNVVLLARLIFILIPYEKSEFFSTETLLNAAHEAEVRNEENVRATIDVYQISDGNMTVRDYYYRL